MSEKSRRKAEKKRRRRNEGVDLSSIDPAELPGPLRKMVRQMGQFQQYLGSAPDLASAIAKATANLVDAADRLAHLAEPYDAFDVLEHVRMSQMPHDSESYKETEHEGTAAVIELVALVLATRVNRAGSRPGEGGHRARVEPELQDILDAASAAVSAGTMLVVLRSMSEPSGNGKLGLGAVMREVYVRNLAYPHMVEELLVTLFGDPAIEAICRSTLGVSVAEILAVFDAMEQAQVDAFGKRMSVLIDLSQLARVEMTKAKEADAKAASPHVGGEDASGYEIEPEVRALGRALLDSAFANPADVSVLDLDDLAARAETSRQVVERVLGLFSIDMSTSRPGIAAEEYFEGRSPLRVRPILRADDGTAMVVNPALVIPAIRERVEEELKRTKEWNLYSKHRGVYLENEVLRLLSGELPGAIIHAGFEYFVPDPKAPQPQAVPAAYSKLVEGDGLLLVDDVALVVEAKAGALSALGRTGNPKKLSADLKNIVTDAAEQGNRTSDRILRDRGLRLRDGTWLDLDHVREVHIIAVSLDDLSGIATVTSELVTAGLLPFDHLPWTVSLHDLRIVCELVDRPAELLLYLRRRTEPDVTRKFHAVDELDFFLEFYSSGLYVDPDPERVEAELPQFGKQPVAARRKFKAQRLTFLTSRTDVLDAYYFHQLGQRLTASPKPKLNANAKLVALVDALSARQDPGWLSMGATLLGAAGPVQQQWGRHGDDLAKLTITDSRPHTLCIIGGSRADDSFVLIWASQGTNQMDTDAKRHLELYTTAKKHQLQVARGFGMLFDGDRPGSPVFTTFDNRRPGPNPDLDGVVKEMMLRPIEQSTRTLPARREWSRRGSA